MSDKKYKEHETICIDCAMQCSQKCSWAFDHVPIEGMKVVKTRNGYDVYECPEFVNMVIKVEDKKEPIRIRPKEFDADGVTDCLKALWAQTKEDYIFGIDIIYDEYGNPVKQRKKQKHKTTYKEQIAEAAENRAKNRKNIEAWLKNEGAKMLMLPDPDAVIQQLRKLARNYEAEKAKRFATLGGGLTP